MKKLSFLISVIVVGHYTNAQDPTVKELQDARAKKETKSDHLQFLDTL